MNHPFEGQGGSYAIDETGSVVLVARTREADEVSEAEPVAEPEPVQVIEVAADPDQHIEWSPEDHA